MEWKEGPTGQIPLLIPNCVRLIVCRPVVFKELHAEVTIINQSVHFASLLARQVRRDRLRELVLRSGC